MDNAVYWIWLQRQLGFGSRAVDWVLEQPGTARYVYDMTEAELLACGAFLERRIPMLANKDLKDAADIYEQCRRLGYTLLTPDDEGYPARLRNIAGPPAVLYIQGELPDIDNEVCIGIVGTRNASEHGMEVGRELALRLTLAGAVIISGGAKGIDTAAHVGSVVAGGKTVSVLGCGIDYRYNMENRPLREQIAKKGALISEYPPGSAPLAKHFPIRNRIIAGLSLGVVVVEGSIRSGSVITADLATEQGRDVFAIPGKVGTINGQCSNRLIQQGAKAITSP
ncbi:MAG: DNA-processing protein DprA, partial [Clostridia bacterium]|nr:DNA-processing protein DprA [Clostridia bacterium]